MKRALLKVPEKNQHYLSCTLAASCLCVFDASTKHSVDLSKENKAQSQVLSINRTRVSASLKTWNEWSTFEMAGISKTGCVT